MFYVGQKVVCVDDHDGDFEATGFGGGRAFGLREGGIYTIARVFDCAETGCRGPFVAVCEINTCGLEGFRVERFRPAVERKTDISLFLAMLNQSKVDA